MDPRANLLLANMPRADFKLIESHLTVAPFTQGAVLAEVGDEIDQVYFSRLSGMISLLTTLNDGKAIETATIGRSGVSGAAAAFGLYHSSVRAIVQVPLIAATLAAPQLKASHRNQRCTPESLHQIQ